MTDLQQAYKIALDNYGKADYCTEYEDVYHFIAEEDRWQFSDSGIAVRKSDGLCRFGYFDRTELIRCYRIENGQFIEYEPEEEEWKKWDFSAEKNTR